MGRVRVAAFSVSLDGYGAGPDQSLDEPMGRRGKDLHTWAFHTRTFRMMFGEEGGETGVDDRFAARSFRNVGAWIIGRNMFGPVRGDWSEPEWTGWWGEEPPYRVPVFVLTNHPRPKLEMKGGTIFHFVTGGIEEALTTARQSAGDVDVRIGGGVSTVRQFLEARAIDELHLAVSPVLLGEGEALFAGLNLPALGYRVVETVAGERAQHVTIRRTGR